MFDKRLSKYFWESEFRCQGRNCCGGVVVAHESILQALDHLRELLGSPLHVSRGFSCFTHNSTIINAAKDSAHCYAYAADVWSNFYKPLEIAEKAEQTKLFKGIGIYKGHCHLDTRPGRERRWNMLV